MEELKQLLERMFHTRKLQGYTHHEGYRGVVTIRFEPCLSSHFDIEPDQRNNTKEYHATFKRKTRSQMNRDKNRSVGFIKHYDTRSRDTHTELPRYSDHFQNIFVSNLSPEASIFTPSIVSQSDVYVSPVSNLDQNLESCDDALISTQHISESHQNTTLSSDTCNGEEPSSPSMRENSPERIDLPAVPDTLNEHTEKQPESKEIPMANTTDSSDGNYRSSLSYRRDKGLAGPVKPRKPRKKSTSSPEHNYVKCHLCKREFDTLSQGCCYYDEYRLKDLLYFCCDKCMNCYRDSEQSVT